MKILFLVPYPPGESPSQRFRFEQYLGHLEGAGNSIEVHSFLDRRGWSIVFLPGKYFKKGWAVVKGFTRRFFLLFRVPGFDVVFIHREAAPFGPPVFEWIIRKILGRKIIYDFDDAIWLTDRMDESSWMKLIKWRSKAGKICRWSYKVSCGNSYLCAYARQFNENVLLNPTTIDTASIDHQRHNSGEFVIGWTGSHSTLRYLEPLVGVFQKLSEKYPQVKILVIADQKPSFNVKSLEFIRWSRECEIEDLSKISVGLMPLPDEEWSKGKCGFKALQYMALSIPALVSPVGVNVEIVEHNSEGFYCSTESDWFDRIEHLMHRNDLCKEMGRRGKEKVNARYSVTSNVSNFLSLFA